MKFRYLTIIAALLLFTGFALAKEKEKPYIATIGDDGVQTINITGGDYFFKPNDIVVKVGVPVKLIVKKNTYIVPHDIVMDAPEAGIKFKVDLDRKGKDIYFIPKKVGVYPFYCDKKLLFFESHREKGMEGKLEVVE
jgi:plastocyanin domain-containing protein